MPYVRQPEEIVPGRPLYFATAMPLAGYGTGLLVESHMGRPIKVEGNPDHPASPLPAEQPAARQFGPPTSSPRRRRWPCTIPDRSQTVNHLGDISSWDIARGWRCKLCRRQDTDRPRLRILTETVTSPTLAGQIAAIRQRFPQARWHVYQPAGRDNARVGARVRLWAAGRDAYRFAGEDGSGAEVILSLDADFLSCGPGHLRYVRDFTSTRNRAHEPARTSA